MNLRPCVRCALTLFSRAMFLVLVLAAGSVGARELSAWTGGATPALAAADPGGKSYDLSSYKGQVVLLNFWATWCAPCRKEMPSMQRLKDKLGNRLVVLAVSMGDHEADIKAFLQKVPVKFPILLDPDSKLAMQWNVQGLPTSFVIDPSGKIRYHLLGETEWDSAKTVNLISGLINK